MAAEKGLVIGHVFKRLDALALLDLEHAIDQQYRVTMRQLPQDLVNIHHDFFISKVIRRLLTFQVA